MALFVVGAVFLVGGCTFHTPSVPAGVSPIEGGPPAPAVEPDYPTNAAGQTYGRLRDDVAPDDAPDLILVRATNGSPGGSGQLGRPWTVTVRDLQGNVIGSSSG